MDFAKNLLLLSYSKDRMGRTILVELAAGRNPPLHLLRKNYKAYAKNYKKGSCPLTEEEYLEYFLKEAFNKDLRAMTRIEILALLSPQGNIHPSLTNLRQR